MKTITDSDVGCVEFVANLLGTKTHETLSDYLHVLARTLAATKSEMQRLETENAALHVRLDGARIVLDKAYTNSYVESITSKCLRVCDDSELIRDIKIIDEYIKQMKELENIVSPKPEVAEVE